MAKSLRRKLREINLEGAYSAEENARLILDERTRILAARQPADAEPAIPASLVLVCQTGVERYGIALADVAEILPAQACVPIPDGPQALVGILGRRGYPVSVIDLGTALGTPASQDAIFHHLVLLRREHPRIALRVERAHSVMTANSLTPEEGQAFRNEAVIGYAEIQSGASEQDRVLSLLDVERLVRPFLPSSSNAPGV
jgi:purine-binding chemotaxis protein CheW